MADGERLDIHNSKIPLVCQSCEARHRGVCGVLNTEQLIFLSERTSKIDYKNKDEMISYNQDNSHYGNILSGVVKLTKLMVDGRQQIVGLQFAPDFLGRPFKAKSTLFAEAATDVRICSFPRSVLEHLIKESPALEHRLHEQTLDELDEARDWLLALGRKDAYEKVASFLLLIASNLDPEHSGPSNNYSFKLPLKRFDIADFLGIRTETVSRQIHKLKKSGIIDLASNQEIVILNTSALQEASAS